MTLLLADAIDRYLAAVEGAGYSPHSAKAYATRLNDFARFVGAGSSAAIPPATIQDYLAHLRHRRTGRRVGVSPQTLQHAWAVLSGFYRWAERTAGIRPNPMRDVLRPRGESSVDPGFRSLTADQLEALLRVAREGWPPSHGPADLRTANRRHEDTLLVGLMGLAGLRVSEVCALDVGDVQGDVVHVLGKGRKRRVVPLAAEVLGELAHYEPPAPGPHLFGAPRAPERRLTAGAVEQRIPRLAQRAGIHELRVTPHVLRHTFGSLMLAADPTALVPTRDLMGHESVETTNRYAHTRDAERRLALASFQELRSRQRR